MAVERIDPPHEAEEREMLLAWLDWQRATLARKCEGLSAEQLRERSAPPSNLSLLGLVRHMSDVERGWFRRALSGEFLPALYWDENEDADFEEVDGAEPAEAFAVWEEEIARAREIVAGVASLDDTFSDEGSRWSLRWTLIHMIEEYARHNGHADLLRERIDGATGQ
jgi:uncharacterized damage-inducible protein DinB